MRAPVLPLAHKTTLLPERNVSRLEAAIAFVRALGLDSEAKALDSTAVSATQDGETLPVADAPADRRSGYLQLAINRGMLELEPQNSGSPKLMVHPDRAITRAELAVLVNSYRDIFGLGNTLAESEAPPAP